MLTALALLAAGLALAPAAWVVYAIAAHARQWRRGR